MSDKSEKEIEKSDIDQNEEVTKDDNKEIIKLDEVPASEKSNPNSSQDETKSINSSENEITPVQKENPKNEMTDNIIEPKECLETTTKEAIAEHIEEDVSQAVEEKPQNEEQIATSDAPNEATEQKKNEASIIEIEDEMSNQTEQSEKETEQIAQQDETKKDGIAIIEIDDDDDEESDTKKEHEKTTETPDQKEDKSNTVEEQTKTAIVEEKEEKMDVDMEEPKENAEPMQTAEISEEMEVDDNTHVDKVISTDATKDEELLEEGTAAPPLSPTPEGNNDDNDVDGEVFYNKECINFECKQNHKQFYKAPQFALSFFKVNKKKFKQQFICLECYDRAVDMYEVSSIFRSYFIFIIFKIFYRNFVVCWKPSNHFCLGTLYVADKKWLKLLIAAMKRIQFKTLKIKVNIFITKLHLIFLNIQNLFKFQMKNTFLKKQLN